MRYAGLLVVAGGAAAVASGCGREARERADALGAFTHG
jgi:hypothetical protein